MSKITYQKNFVKRNWTLVSVDHWQPQRQMISGHSLKLSESLLCIIDHTGNVSLNFKAFFFNSGKEKLTSGHDK